MAIADDDGVSPRADEADARPTLVLTAEWALWGKRVPGPQDGVLMCSAGTLGALDFTEIINRYAPGTPDSLQYTMGWFPGADSAPDFVTLAIHQHSPYGPAQPGTCGRYGTPGRDIVTVRLFCVRYADLAEHGVSYAELLGAVQRLEPASGSLPVTVSIPARQAPGPDGGPAAELAQAVATLLLTEMPVCVLGADEVSAAARVSFIDAVMSWLPYGLRARLSASTWASSTAQGLKLRLFFASARRDDDGRTHHVRWGEPPRLALDRGRDEAAALYLDWLRRTGQQAQAPLAGLTKPLRFGAADIRPMVAALPREVTLAEALEDLAASLRHGDGMAAKADIRRLRRYLAAPLDPAERDRCHRQVMEQALLKNHPEIQPGIKASVYRVLLSLAFETPLTYTGYCQIEDASGGPPHRLVAAAHPAALIAAPRATNVLAPGAAMILRVGSSPKAGSERDSYEEKIHGADRGVGVRDADERLVSALHAAGLVDEYRLMVFPIVVGGGKSLFDGVGMPVSLYRLRSHDRGGHAAAPVRPGLTLRDTAAERTPDIASPMPCYPPCERYGQL